MQKMSCFYTDLFLLCTCSAAKNCVQEEPVNNVVSHWCRFESDCSFRLFSNSWKFTWSTSKINLSYKVLSFCMLNML